MSYLKFKEWYYEIVMVVGYEDIYFVLGINEVFFGFDQEYDVYLKVIG